MNATLPAQMEMLGSVLHTTSCLPSHQPTASLPHRNLCVAFGNPLLHFSEAYRSPSGRGPM